MARNYSSIAGVKTLANDITDIAATQLTLSENTDDLPSPPFTLVINPDTAKEEIVTVQLDQSGVSEPTYKIIRGQELTTPTTHTQGDIVKHMITGRDLQEAQDHIGNTTTAHNLNLKAPLASPTFTGNVVLPSTTSIGSVTSTEIGYVDGVTSAIQTQLNALTSSIASIVTVPAGVINPWAGVAGSPPTGWLLCDGTAVSRSTYSTLFGIVGTAYGVGDNSTTFNLPNLKGKVPVGLDSTQTEFDTRGETGGEKAVTLTQGQIPSFSHELQMASTGDGTTYFRGSNGPYSTSVYYSHGSGQAHNNLQPYLVVNYIIKF